MHDRCPNHQGPSLVLRIKEDGQIAVKGNGGSSSPKCYFSRIVTVSVAVIMAIASIGIVANTTSAQAGQAPAQESNQNLPAGLVANDAVITVPLGILPGHVYVLSSGEVVIEKPSPQSDKVVAIAEEPSPHSETASHSATIRASVKGAASRLIVVDENDRIVEIWSNTTGLKCSFYSLRIKEQPTQGPEHPLTQEILTQYNRLLGEVNWNKRDRVYS